MKPLAKSLAQSLPQFLTLPLSLLTLMLTLGAALSNPLFAQASKPIANTESATATVADITDAAKSKPEPAHASERKTISINREIFQYTAVSRRDPFVSLLTSDELRPLISDLKLTTIAYDATGQNSVAVLRNLETKQQYRVKRGAQLGRMRVVRIDPRSITFMIEEFGFSRHETLALPESTSTNTP